MRWSLRCVVCLDRRPEGWKKHVGTWTAGWPFARVCRFVYLGPWSLFLQVDR
jgi:hypothetical protein